MSNTVPKDIVLELEVGSPEVDAFASVVERLTAAGIVFVSLRDLQASEANWLAHLTTLDDATRSATGDPHVPRSTDTMAMRLGELQIDPNACFVARLEDLWIGYSVLDTAHSSKECLHQSWTGVLPAYRRRGIGTAFKVLTVQYARRHGYRRIASTLRVDNTASRALNERVGFRPPEA